MHTGVGSPILTFVDFVGSFGKTQPPQPSVVEFVLFCAAANETKIANKQYSIRIIFVFCNKKRVCSRRGKQGSDKSLQLQAVL
mmetsp:Transcript_30352/g.54919  ORF Transcript_30352/g.54919 Transcript_30352/m.54919 type:complete len:83 (-) Transcript_30352:22-270(-)